MLMADFDWQISNDLFLGFLAFVVGGFFGFA
jgi:hypothetical protein